MNESRYTYGYVTIHSYMSHVTLMNASRYIHTWVTLHLWMSHVIWTRTTTFTDMTHWVTQMQIHESRCSSGWDTLQFWMSHVTLMNESRYTYEWVTSYEWGRMLSTRLIESPNCNTPVSLQSCMRHVAHVNASCRTRECVMSHVWMTRVTHVNESFRTYEWVISHVWMSHFARMNETWHSLGPRGDADQDKLQWVTHTWMRHVSHIKASCHPYQWIWIRHVLEVSLGLRDHLPFCRDESCHALQVPLGLLITTNAINCYEFHPHEWVTSPI